MWHDVEKRFAKEVEEIKSEIKNYDYSEKHAVHTDEKIRSLFSERLQNSKSLLTSIMEIAYNEAAPQLNVLKKLREDINLLIDEIRKYDFGKFPKDKKVLEKILESDILLLNGTKLMGESVETLHRNVLNSQIQNLEREVQGIESKLRQVKSCFEQREKLIKAEYG